MRVTWQFRIWISFSNTNSLLYWCYYLYTQISCRSQVTLNSEITNRVAPEEKKIYEEYYKCGQSGSNYIDIMIYAKLIMDPPFKTNRSFDSKQYLANLASSRGVGISNVFTTETIPFLISIAA